MKYYFLSTIFLLGLSFSTLKAEDNSKTIEYLKTEVSNLNTQQELLHKEFKTLSSKISETEGQISEIQTTNKKLVSNIDSLQKDYNTLVANQKADKSEIVNSIDKTNELIQTTENVLSSRTLWVTCGLVILLSVIIATIFAFLKKIKLGTSSIDEVRKAQEALGVAQKKMQEESIKLDNQMLAIVQKQLESKPTTSVGTAVPDHSLALKVADEIVRIELNMSRMDSSIKGYKQLTKAVERIKDNFNANGYEIVDMLGKPYNEGMKVTANFVADEDLEEGKQIITGITKPQINYNGQMIQAAQITVSQNI